MDQTSFLPKEQQNRMPGHWRPRGRGGWGGKRKRTTTDTGFSKTCEVCNIVLTRKFEYDSHMIGKRHKKALKKKELNEKLEKERAVVGSRIGNQPNGVVVVDPKTSLRTCTVCSLAFSSPMIEESHMKGKKHLKMLKMLSNGPMMPKPPARGYVGKCDICAVYYTSPTEMKSHLAGKKHRKKCAVTAEPGGRGFPTPSNQLPPAKKMKLQPLLTQSSGKMPVLKPAAHELLEIQAEEAYEEYKRVAEKIPLEEAQALYFKYQTIYRAYEAAYQQHTSKEGKK